MHDPLSMRIRQASCRLQNTVYRLPHRQWSRSTHVGGQIASFDKLHNEKLGSLGFVGVVGYHLLRALSGLRRERADAALPPVETQGALVEVAAAPAPKLSDAERWLELSSQAGAESRYADAIRAAYAALAHSLRAHGFVALEQGQTNGELLRALQGHPELAREFREVAREMELVEFGGRSADRPTFERVSSPAEPYPRAHAGPCRCTVRSRSLG